MKGICDHVFEQFTTRQRATAQQLQFLPDFRDAHFRLTATLRG